MMDSRECDSKMSTGLARGYIMYEMSQALRPCLVASYWQRSQVILHPLAIAAKK